MTTTTGPGPAIPIDPRIAERRQAVADQANRVRQRQLIAVLGVLAVGVAAFAVLNSSLFAVDRVVIQGTTTHVDAVAEASQVEIGTPLIRVDLTAAREAIADLPAIVSVSSRRTWGGDVIFSVVEREPVAQIETASGVDLIVDAAGRIISRASSGASTPGPLRITGLAVVDDGRALWVDDYGADAVRVAAGVPADVVAVTKQMVVTPGDYRLELDNDVVVILGDHDSMEQQMRALRSVVAKVDMHCVTTIDLRTADSPVVRRSSGCV